MYAALWRALPGNRLAKLAEALVLFGLLVGVLFVWVFPALAPLLPFENVTVETPATGPLAPGQPSTTAPATTTPSAGPKTTATPSTSTPTTATPRPSATKRG